MNFEIEKNANTKTKILNFLKSSKLKQFNSKQYLIETSIQEKNLQDNYYENSVNSCVNSEINSIINSSIDSNLKNFCNICNNQNDGQFIILSCNHTFHIKCVASKMNLNNTYIDQNSFYCEMCNYILDSSEILYIYNKFYKETNNYIHDCDSKIKDLEKNLNKIKDELRINFEYKQKLEKSKEYSKIVILTLNNNL